MQSASVSACMLAPGCCPHRWRAVARELGGSVAVAGATCSNVSGLLFSQPGRSVSCRRNPRKQWPIPSRPLALGALIQPRSFPRPRYPPKTFPRTDPMAAVRIHYSQTARRIDISLTPCCSNLPPSLAPTRKHTFPTALLLSHQAQYLAPVLSTPTKVACNRSAMPACSA